MERTFLQVLGLTGTVEILEYLKEHNTASYKDFNQFISIATLTKRLKQLTRFGLIQHNFRKENRKEWYTLTTKGKKVLKIIKELQKAIEE